MCITICFSVHRSLSKPCYTGCIYMVSHYCTFYQVFSPVCIIICLLSLYLLTNALSHWLHSHGFTPLNDTRWIRKFLYSKKVFSHWCHVCLSIIYAIRCIIKFPSLFKMTDIIWLLTGYVLEHLIITTTIESSAPYYWLH